MDARQVIIEPVVSEKSYALMADGKYTFRIDDRAHKTQVSHAVEEIFGVTVVARADDEGALEAQAPRHAQRPHARLAQGDRAARTGRPDRAVRGRGGGGLRSLMAVRKTRPTSPGRRFATYQMREELTGDAPNKKLTKGKSKSGGRNAHGRVTSRHRGGGAKRRYREIDFKRLKDDVPAKVATIEYDPNRTTYIALLHYADGAKSYILAPQGLAPGDEVDSGPSADIRPGNALPLRSIPTGTIVHNVEMTPGQGGRMGRAAGSAIQVVAKEGPTVTLRLPSSEMRLVRADCRATIGTLSNAEHQNVVVGKAGRKRHKGVRPQTRGVAMNPVDHPHGGGEAHKTPGGHPRTPWGKPTLGYRTRKKGKRSDDDPARPPARQAQGRQPLMGRSTKKGPFVEERLMKRINAMNESGDKQMVKTWSRTSTVFPEMVGPHDRRPRRP